MSPFLYMCVTCLRICPCLRATMFYLPETNKNHCLPCPCVSWNGRYTQLSHALKRGTKASAPRKMLIPKRLWSFGIESLKFCFGKGDITRFLPQGLVSHLRGLYSCIATKVCGRALMAWRTCHWALRGIFQQTSLEEHQEKTTSHHRTTPGMIPSTHKCGPQRWEGRVLFH